MINDFDEDDANDDMSWSVRADEEEEGTPASAMEAGDLAAEGPAGAAELAAGLGASAGEMAGVLEAVAAEVDGGSALSDPRVRHCTTSGFAEHLGSEA